MADLARVTRTTLSSPKNTKSKGGLLSDPKKLAATGVGIAALPVAIEQIAKRVAPKVSDLGGQAKDKLTDVASDTMSNLGEQAKQTAKHAAKGAAVSKLKPGSSDGEGEGFLSKLKPGSGDEGEDEQGRAAPGQGGSGRRMPVQQSVDVAVPIKVAYNRWTLFEDWPEFMHRVESVDQVDDTTLSFATKVWGITRRFEAKIVEQRPDQRIEWNSTEGLAHTGVVTFHKLADRLTRIELSMDVEPHGPLEKMGRGLRFTKRAVRADLHRFKALIELEEEAEGGWRGTIRNGKVERRTERRTSGSRRRRRAPSPNGARASSQRSASRSRS
jgi:uncharacterized membrane protein/histone H3/H4